jgi:hypothetical protein
VEFSWLADGRVSDELVGKAFWDKVFDYSYIVAGS